MAPERAARTRPFEEVTSWSQSSSVGGFHPMHEVGLETFKGPCLLRGAEGPGSLFQLLEGPPSFLQVENCQPSPGSCQGLLS